MRHERIKSPYSNIKRLHCLFEVASTGSMAAATKRLGLQSSSSVSDSIKKLESELEVQLLERHGRGGCVLTAEGKRVVSSFITDVGRFPPSGVAAGTLQRLSRREHTKDPRPDFRIAASTTTSEVFAPFWINLFEDELERVTPLRVEMMTTRSYSVLQEVKDDRVQMGFIAAPVTDKQLRQDGFESAVVGHDEVLIVVSPNHSWAGEEAITVDALFQEPQIARYDGSGLLESLRRALDAHRRPGQEIAIANRMNSNASLRQAIMALNRPAALSSLAVVEELRLGTLHKVEVTGLTPIRRERRAVWRRKSPLVHKMVAIARENSNYDVMVENLKSA